MGATRRRWWQRVRWPVAAWLAQLYGWLLERRHPWVVERHVDPEAIAEGCWIDRCRACAREWPAYVVQIAQHRGKGSVLAWPATAGSLGVYCTMADPAISSSHQLRIAQSSCGNDNSKNPLSS